MGGKLPGLHGGKLQFQAVPAQGPPCAGGYFSVTLWGRQDGKMDFRDCVVQGVRCKRAAILARVANVSEWGNAGEWRACGAWPWAR